jgi:hypothetical protein
VTYPFPYTTAINDTALFAKLYFMLLDAIGACKGGVVFGIVGNRSKAIGVIILIAEIAQCLNPIVASRAQVLTAEHVQYVEGKENLIASITYRVYD